MIKNYLKITFRNLHRHPFYAFVNIFGLALGIACCILIMLFIRDEWSYDKFHSDANRIYRVALFELYEDHEYLNVVTPFRFASMFEENIPEVEAAVRFVAMRDQVQKGATTSSETIYMADKDFFQMFDFELKEGRPEGVLESVNNLVLSETAAQKWFGPQNPVGQTLSIRVGESAEDYIVAGIAAVPTNSSLQFDYLVPLENADKLWTERQMQSLFNVYAETFIRLPDGYEITNLDAKMPALIQQVMGEEYVEGAYVPRFQSLTDIHLDTSYPGGSQPTSDPSYSYILALIAAFVLIIACINFMTLTLGRSADRAKEVGVRKTLGAMREQVAGQFWGEAIWFSLLGLMVGGGLAFLVLPVFEDLAEKDLALTFELDLVLLVFGLVGLVGLIAGSYPALFLSKFQPVKVLKGQLKMGHANVLRKSLTVIQFALAILLIISTLVIKDQLNFLQSRPLGFDKEQVVSLQTGLPRAEGMAVLERFRNEAGSYPEITDISGAVYTFGETWIAAGYRGDDDIFRQFNVNLVDVDFLNTMQIPVVQGRDFSRDISADEREAVIVNRAFAKLHGWEDPVGKQLPGVSFAAHQIIGMVDDFNYASLHEAVAPLALVLSPEPLFSGLNDVSTNSAPQPKVIARIGAGRTKEGLEYLENAWEAAAPGLPFVFTFVDDAVERQYRQEERLGAIVEYATVLVILIACLGLLGLASIVVSRRTKEIGVRKVMGASVQNIVLLLSKDFITLVVIAFLVAVPVAYLVMKDWLSDFAFATTLSPFTFGLAGVLAILVAFVTISFQSIKAALSNPVKALKYE